MLIYCMKNYLKTKKSDFLIIKILYNLIQKWKVLQISRKSHKEDEKLKSNNNNATKLLTKQFEKYLLRKYSDNRSVVINCNCQSF